MSLQQEMVQMTDDGLSASQVVHYPILGTIVPPAQYVEMSDVRVAVEQTNEQKKGKEEFLMQYYKRILTQHGIVLGLFLFGQMEWVMSIFVSGWYSRSFRWTWFVNLAILILIALGLPITRYYRCVVQHQNKLFHTQTFVIAFLLIGIAGVQKSNYSNHHHAATVWWIIITLLILIAHSIAQIVLVRKSVTHYYTAFMKFAIMGSIVLNFVVALCCGFVDSPFIIAEAIIIYSLYYFNQLNESLLNKNELPEDISFMERIKIINKIKELFNQEAQQNQVIEQIKDTHCVINRYLAIVGVSVVAYIVVLILSIVTGNALFIVIVIVTSVSVLSLVLNTQVASRSLQDEDVSFAVCMTYMDLASPFKNLLRGVLQ